jgi:CRP-like cAMP-binding protein
MRPTSHLTVLLEGLACTSIRHEDGARQIYSFHYPGDFVGLYHYVFPQMQERIELESLADCSIGTIDNESMDQLLRRHPALGLAVWRAAMIDANTSRERLAIMRRPALQRVAYVLCEQLVRRAVLGIDNNLIPLSQMEVADSAGLSAVHTNRVFQDLRKLGVLSKRRQIVEVVNKAHLQEIAVFDGRSFRPDEFLSRWDVRLRVQDLVSPDREASRKGAAPLY